MIKSAFIHSLQLNRLRNCLYVADKLLMKIQHLLNIKKRPSFPVSHKTLFRPLLPSGPGGVEQRLVAQDLTSSLGHLESMH